MNKAASKADKSASPKERKPFPALATSNIPRVAMMTATLSRDVVLSLIRMGESTASITGLVLTRKVAFATVVNLTARINVAKWRLNITPDMATSKRSLLLKLVKRRVA
jgi:hypothetical protein